MYEIPFKHQNEARSCRQVVKRSSAIHLLQKGVQILFFIFFIFFFLGGQHTRVDLSFTFWHHLRQQTVWDSQL